SNGAVVAREHLLSEPSEPRGSQTRPSLGLLRGAQSGPLVSRRRLQIALALFWLLDGALQLQPFMFTRGFAEQVIAPAAGGQPAFVVDPVHWSAALILGHPVLWDALFAAVQLAIGAGLLFRRTVRPAIVVSIGWALGVWVLGEGIGGLAGGTATFLTGAPGAVILYGLVGLAAWPRLEAEGRASLSSSSAGLRARSRVLFAPAGDGRPAAWVPAAWAALWCLFALLRAVSATYSAGSLADQLRASASSAPGWLAQAERSLATAAGHGIGPVLALVLVEAAVGVLALWEGAPRRIAVAVGVGLALAVWVMGQAFGQISTGMGTDPSSAPLVVLLAAALWGSGATEPAMPLWAGRWHSGSELPRGARRRVASALPPP
ncbi:MAG: hypothetical protein ACRDXC_05845, partial [Acidimicrobiales bacterium]